MVTVKDLTSNISASRKRRFLNAQVVLRKAVDILISEYNVTRIVLVGSLTNKSRFGFHSDIDLCVEGLPDELYFKAVGKLLMLSNEFDIDIIPLESVPPERREKIKKGKLLYEKR